MPDIYIQDSLMSNTIFLYLAGMAAVYGVYWLFTRKK